MVFTTAYVLALIGGALALTVGSLVVAMLCTLVCLAILGRAVILGWPDTA